MRTAISSVLIIAAVLIFYFAVDPAYQEVKALKIQVADYNQALDSSTKLRQKRADLMTKYNSIDPANIARIQKLLPDGVDNIRLILDINGIASTYGMSLKNIKLSTPTQSTNDTGTNQNPVGSIQLAFTVTTTYENFTQFLQNLEESLRLVDVVGISFISSKDKDQTNLSDYNLTIQTYWLK